jgi:hypothetical protein
MNVLRNRIRSLSSARRSPAPRPHRHQGRRPPQRLRLEELETRLVPTCWPSFISNGVLTLNGDNTGNQIETYTVGIGTEFAEQIFRFRDASGGFSTTGDYVDRFSSIQINPGAGNNNVTIDRTFRPLLVNSGGGLDDVTVGQNGFVSAAPITVQNPPPNGYTYLHVADQNNPSATTATLTATRLTLQRDGQTEEINYHQQDLRGLDVFLGNARNDVNVVDTPQSGFSGGVSTNIYTGIGPNNVNVLATSGRSLNLNGNSPNTTVNVGNNGRLDGIQSRGITIANRNGDTGVVIDDHNDPGVVGTTLTATFDTIRTDALYEQIAGLAHATIYVQRSTTTRNVDVYTGTGSVTANVLATIGRGLNLNGNSPNTTVNVGNNGSLAGIQSLQMTISNRNGDTAVVIDDHNRGGATATFDTITTDGQFVQIAGLAARATIYAQCAATRDVDVYTGPGAVTDYVLATCGHGLNLHGNSAGNNTLVGPNAPTDFRITGSNAGNLSRGASASFSNIQNLTGGSGNDNFIFADGAGVGGNVSGGRPGANTLDYTAYSTSVIVDLQTGFATGVGGSVSAITVVFGGTGNGALGAYNLLIGVPAGGDVVGDTLNGGLGRRNLLVAGGGASTLNAGDQEDLLIGGTTLYDTEAGLVSWLQIATYWAGTDSYGTRVSNLTSGSGVPLLDATTVTGNGGGNAMNGNGALALIYTDGADAIEGFDPGSLQVLIAP